MATTIEFPELHAQQRQVLDEMKRYNCLVAGRRWGKNVVASHMLMEPALKGLPVALFSPEYKLLSESFRDLKTILAPATVRVSEADYRIELTSKGVVECWSLHNNPNAGRSRKYARVVVDEAGQIEDLENIFYASIRPTLTDLKGDAILMGTPRGRGFFYRAWTKGKDPDNKNWASWRFKTEDNPHLPAGECEEARKSLPERIYRQEYDAEFLLDSGGVFCDISGLVSPGLSAEIIASELAEYRTKQFWEPSRYRGDLHSYFAGLDLARLHDFTALTILDETGRQVYHDRFNKMSWEAQINRLIDPLERFRPSLLLDVTGLGDVVLDNLQNDRRIQNLGIVISPFRFTAASKMQVMNRLALGFEQGKLSLMDIPVQTAEIQNYEYTITKTGNASMNAPTGEHDDTVVALALAYFGVEGGGYYSAGAC
jgi:hypothetical protein